MVLMLMIIILHRRVVPVEGELTLCPEEVDVVLELEFEHIVFGDVVTWGGSVHIVAE